MSCPKCVTLSAGKNDEIKKMDKICVLILRRNTEIDKRVEKKYVFIARCVAYISKLGLKWHLGVNENIKK